MAKIRRAGYSNRFASALSGVDLDNPATGRGRTGGTVVVPRITGRSAGCGRSSGAMSNSCVPTPRGFPERARHEAQASLGEVRGSDHQLTMCRVLFYGMGRISPMTGDFAAAETAISSIIESATSAVAPFWTTVGQFLRGKLLVERHQFAEGLAVLREAFDTCNQTGWRLSYPEFMGSFALALAGLERLDEARDAVCRAIEAAGEGKTANSGMSPNCSASRARCC